MVELNRPNTCESLYTSLLFPPAVRGSNGSTRRSPSMASLIRADSQQRCFLVLGEGTGDLVLVLAHRLEMVDALSPSESTAKGQIELKWAHGAGGQLTVHWTEMDGPAVQTPSRRGFGSRVIEQMIGQLNGTARFDWRPTKP